MNIQKEPTIFKCVFCKNRYHVEGLDVRCKYYSWSEVKELERQFDECPKADYSRC